MYYSLDRIEENVAVLIDDLKQNTYLDTALLPPNYKIGDVFMLEDGKLVLQSDETEKRKEKVLELQFSLMNKKKKTP